MGFGSIKIFKVFERDNIGYYKISTTDFNSMDFYMGINKPKRTISFYATEDFAKPTHIIDCNKNEPIGEIPKVDFKVLSRAFVQGVKTFDLENFPESLSYAA